MALNPNLLRLREAGVSIWLDTLSRELLESGGFAELIRDYGVTGATSNPTIFAKAITHSDRYDGQLRELAASRAARSAGAVLLARARRHPRGRPPAAPGLRAPPGSDGFISFECTPDLADDTEATIAQATDLWQRLGQPNVMIKVPGTAAGLPAIEELTRRGVNVNITLLFSVERYEQVIDAYLRGLSARADAGEPVDTITSAASFFLSRIDTKADALLDEGSAARGRVAIASARVAYQRYGAKFAGPEWERLREPGARRQRPLWASTGTKNPAYSDVLYVIGLIGPDVINTMPEQTLRAFADHGTVARTVDADPDAAERMLAAAAAARARPRRRHRPARARWRRLVLRLLSSAAGLHRAQTRRRGRAAVTLARLTPWEGCFRSILTFGIRCRTGGRSSRHGARGAPSVLYIVLDDVGFSAMSCTAGRSRPEHR